MINGRNIFRSIITPTRPEGQKLFIFLRISTVHVPLLWQYAVPTMQVATATATTR